MDFLELNHEKYSLIRFIVKKNPKMNHEEVI